MAGLDLYTILLIYIPALALAIAVHELGHGLAGHLLGDPTPKEQGRLTLNPISHLDPLGITLPLVLALAGSPMMFGWGKPILINYANLRKPIRDEILVAAAGPFMNLLLCLGCLVAWRPVYEFLRYGTILGFGGLAENGALLAFMTWARLFLWFGLNINVGLMLFNLLPFPPLDGSKILFNLFGETGKKLYTRLEPFGFLALIILLFSGRIEPILGPAYQFVMELFIHRS